MAETNKLLKKIIKNKKLIKTNNSQYVIIPSTWISALGWNKKKLIMAINPINEEIIIRAKEDVIYGEEAN